MVNQVTKPRKTKKSGEDDEDEDQGVTPTGVWNWLQKHLIPDFSDFGFGDILFWGLMLTGLYFLARTETGQNFISDLLGKDGKQKVAEFFEKGDLMIAGLLDKVGLGDVGRKIFGDVAEAAVSTPSAQKAHGLLQHKLPPEAADALTKTNGQFDDAKWRGLQADVRAVNPGKKLSESFETPETLMMMLTKRPEMTRELLVALKQSGKAESSATMVANINALLKDDAKLTLLLGDAHRKNTLGLMQLVSPMPLKDGALEAFINRTGVVNGQPTAELKILVQSLAAEGTTPTSMLPALLTYTGTTKERVDALSDLAKTVDTKSLDAGSQTGVILLQHNAQQTITLVQQLGPEKTNQLMALAQNSADATAQQALQNFVLMTPGNATIIKTFADSVKLETLPEAMRPAMVQLKETPLATLTAAATAQQTLALNPTTANGVTSVNALVSRYLDENGTPSAERITANLLNSKERDTLRSVGMGNLAIIVATDPSQSAQTNAAAVASTTQNLRTMLHFGDAIGGNPNNAKDNAAIARTHAVMGAITAMAIEKDITAFMTLPAADIAGFFKDEKNQQAFGGVLKSLDIRGLPPQQQALLTTLKTHWGNQQDGLAEVFASEADVKKLFQLVANSQASWVPDFLKPDFIKVRELEQQDGKIAENARHILALGEALKGANITASTVVATAAAPTSGALKPGLGSSPMRQHNPAL